MSYQVSDTKKEDFRKYLERAGIVDALTKVLVGLYEQPDKPENPLEYMQHFLAGPASTGAIGRYHGNDPAAAAAAGDAAVRAENADLRRTVDELAARVDELTRALTAAGVAVPPPPPPAATVMGGGGMGAGSGVGGSGVAGDGTGDGSAVGGMGGDGTAAGESTA
ncbi:hypothetical protein BC828DRAFT_378525 [Blastocladiella britannica]|nr:hypothetical protein BC828DRAFT_378525 [Blastocladiella britannica]